MAAQSKGYHGVFLLNVCGSGSSCQTSCGTAATSSHTSDIQVLREEPFYYTSATYFR